VSECGPDCPCCGDVTEEGYEGLDVDESDLITIPDAPDGAVAACDCGNPNCDGNHGDTGEFGNDDVSSTFDNEDTPDYTGIETDLFDIPDADPVQEVGECGPDCPCCGGDTEEDYEGLDVDGLDDIPAAPDSEVAVCDCGNPNCDGNHGDEGSFANDNDSIFEDTSDLDHREEGGLDDDQLDDIPDLEPEKPVKPQLKMQ